MIYFFMKKLDINIKMNHINDIFYIFGISCINGT